MTDEIPEEAQPEWIAPGRTALLLIDMQVDFGSARRRDGAGVAPT